MRKFALLINLIAFLWILNGCSGGGGDNNQTGNRGAPGNGLDGSGVAGSTEFLMEHDGDGVNTFTGAGLADSDGVVPDICGATAPGSLSAAGCPFMGLLVKYTPTVAIATPFTIRSISYYVPGGPCGAEPTTSAEFVVYEGGSDVPGLELIRIAISLDDSGATPAVPSLDPSGLKVYTFSSPIIIADLLGGDIDGSFYAGIEWANPVATATVFFSVGFDVDPTPFPDPSDPWTPADPYPTTTPPGCPPVLPDSFPPSGSVPPTECLDPLFTASGRGTTYIKCDASGSYGAFVATTTPFGPAGDVIFTLEIGP